MASFPFYPEKDSALILIGTAASISMPALRFERADD
jgi:hypothetical protein